MSQSVSYGKNAPKEVNVIIEIQRGSRNKYEIDEETGAITLDRVQPTFFGMPYDYGSVPGTLGEDNDPLDAMIIIDESVLPGIVVPARVLGVMFMVDDGENDEKLICVAADDKSKEHIKTLADLGEHFPKALQHYFEHYKDLQNKEVKINGFGEFEEAAKVIEASIERAKN